MDTKKNKHKLKKMLPWVFGALCLGCATDGSDGLPKYDSQSGESYYTWLYKDSAFLECPGDPMRPWQDPVDWSKYYPIYFRMARHLEYRDTLIWDFTAEELKVAPRVYDYLVATWKYDNKRLRSKRFKIELFANAYRYRPIGDISDLDFENP